MRLNRSRSSAANIAVANASSLVLSSSMTPELLGVSSLDDLRFCSESRARLRLSLPSSSLGSLSPSGGVLGKLERLDPVDDFQGRTRRKWRASRLRRLVGVEGRARGLCSFMLFRGLDRGGANSCTMSMSSNLQPQSQVALTEDILGGLRNSGQEVMLCVMRSYDGL